MDTQEQVHDRPKVSWWKSSWIKSLAIWLPILIAGSFLIATLSTHIATNREAALYRNTYVSMQPFGPKIDKVHIADFPNRVWLNYQAEIPKECQIFVSSMFRKVVKVNGQDYVVVLSTDNPNTEFRAQPTGAGAVRNVSWLLTLHGVDYLPKTVGHYEVVRLSRFQCGTNKVDGLTAWQVTGFDVIP